MKVLAVRQPWAWLIVYAGKDIENRRWQTRYRGPFAILATRGPDMGSVEEIEWLYDVRIPRNLPRGGIVGLATVTDCVTAHDSRWFFGPYGLVLAGARPLPFLPMRGLPFRFFDAPAATEAAIRDTLAGAAPVASPASP